MRYLRATAVVFCLAGVPALCQQGLVPDNKPLASRDFALPSIPVPGCPQLNDSDRNMKARSCYEAKRIIGTGVFLRALAQSGFSEWRGTSKDYIRGENELEDHLERFYTRRAANALGEWIGGSIGHEALQPTASGKNGFWNRSAAAMMSVVAIHEGDNWRPALAPLTGSVASGFVTMGCCGPRDSLNWALFRTGFTYSGYFATAMFREFKPDLKAYAFRKLHRTN